MGPMGPMLTSCDRAFMAGSMSSHWVCSMQSTATEARCRVVPDSSFSSSTVQWRGVSKLQGKGQVGAETLAVKILDEIAHGERQRQAGMEAKGTPFVGS